MHVLLRFSHTRIFVPFLLSLPLTNDNRYVISQDCGYVFTKGPKAWAALPDDWSCPPCGAPKYRFKKVPKGSESGKVKVKKSWF